MSFLDFVLTWSHVPADTLRPDPRGDVAADLAACVAAGCLPADGTSYAALVEHLQQHTPAPWVLPALAALHRLYQNAA